MAQPEKCDLDPAEFDGEPTDRLESRALDGLRFAQAAIRRLRRTLPKWLRQDGQLDPARCIAAVIAVNVALAGMSPLNMQRLARKVRRRMITKQEAP